MMVRLGTEEGDDVIKVITGFDPDVGLGNKALVIALKSVTVDVRSDVVEVTGAASVVDVVVVVEIGLLLEA